jgi:hypothetical protein
LLTTVRASQHRQRGCPATFCLPRDDIDNGRLNMVIGIAPLKPAEFVIFRIGQWQDKSDPASVPAALTS